MPSKSDGTSWQVVEKPAETNERGVVEATAFLEAQRAVDTALSVTGSIPSSVQVGSYTVRVGGAIVDGAAQIRTLYIPRMFP